MEREPFIRAIEVWVPSQDGQTIDLQSGVYGEMDYFASISRGMKFALDEGLPGKTWRQGRPLLLTDLRNSFFVRREAALSEGLSCAVSLPSFDDTGLVAVTLLFCGDDRFREGALALWAPGESGRDMRLVGSFSGYADASCRCGLSALSGLQVPGRVHESGKPLIRGDWPSVDHCGSVDGSNGIDSLRFIGLPCALSEGSPWVLTLMASGGVPLAGRVEYWVVDTGANAFRFHAGFCEGGMSLSQIYEGVEVSRDSGSFARACRKGVPVVDEDLATDLTSPIAGRAVAAGLKSMVVMPLRSADGWDSVVVWYF